MYSREYLKDIRYSQGQIEIDLLASAFIWDGTDEGHDFWSKQYYEKRLDAEGRRIWEAMNEAAKKLGVGVRK